MAGGRTFHLTAGAVYALARPGDPLAAYAGAMADAIIAALRRNRRPSVDGHAWIEDMLESGGVDHLVDAVAAVDGVEVVTRCGRRLWVDAIKAPGGADHEGTGAGRPCGDCLKAVQEGIDRGPASER